jgi:hypothetical protein
MVKFLKVRRGGGAQADAAQGLEAQAHSVPTSMLCLRTAECLPHQDVCCCGSLQ